MAQAISWRQSRPLHCLRDNIWCVRNAVKKVTRQQISAQTKILCSGNQRGAAFTTLLCTLISVHYGVLQCGENRIHAQIMQGEQVGKIDLWCHRT